MRLSPKNVISLILLVAIAVVLAISFLPLGGEPKLDLKIRYKRQIISAAYKVYGRPELKFWVAKTVIKNVGEVPIRNVEVSYSIEGFTDWSTPVKYDEIPPGGALVDLYYPMLPSKVATLTSPVPAKLHVKISYDKWGKRETIVETKDIEVLGVHDMVFSSIPPEEALPTFEDRFSNAPLLAAWVTPGDPVVREFSDLGNKLAGGAGAALSDREAFKTMEGVWKALLKIGMSYKTEPEGYWTGKFAEYIKFPRDTILDGQGTCIDLTLMYASLLSAQGLVHTYIVLVPGHAFPIVRLPESGAMIPVETTTLNSGASLREAIQTAVYNWQNRFSKGPYLIVDVYSWQASGVTPPELPSLPPDILERKGIKQKLEGYIKLIGGELKSYSNGLFSIKVPSSWKSDSGTDEEGTYQSWFTDDEGIILYTSWTPFQGSLSDYVTYIESLYPEITRVNLQQGQFGSCPYAMASYQWVNEGVPWMSNELYMACRGYGIHVALMAQKTYWDDGTASTVWERVIYTFYPNIAAGG